MKNILHMGDNQSCKKAGSTGSAEPDFFYISAKFVQFSAKLLSLNM